ncbi:MAG: cobalamin-dependent protein [Coriobacteriia bacterium]|nr:cobalamin-dependent protein [Coriobacteriia bacterium]
MRVTLISPPFGEGGQRSKGLPIAPPVLEYLAGLTEQVRPGEHDVTLVDANVREFDPRACEADLVGMTVLTPQAPWAYRTADVLRRRGVQVVLGGIHVHALPEEAAAHADAILVGEAETVWGRILDDAGRRRLERRYDGPYAPLDGLPRPRTGLLPDRYLFGSFFTSRGCPHSCAFCSVHGFFGRTVRMRPIGEVVEEVAASPKRLFWNIDDNVWGVNVRRSIDLYREMAEQVRGKWWFGSGDLVTLQHSRADELLEWARRAGMTAAMVGFESANPLVLEELDATIKQGKDRLDAIRRIRAAGIDVMLFVMVGSRADSMRDFDAIRELSSRLDVAVHPVMTTPFPGTALYERYREFLIPGQTWDLFDGNHANFFHDDPEMTPEARETALVELRDELFTIPKILRRIIRIGMKGFPMAHITSWAVQYPQGRAFHEFATAHRQMHAGGQEA